MVQLERITGHIISEAKDEAKKILDEADLQCKAILDDAKKAAEAEKESILKDADSDKKTILSLANTSAEHEKALSVLGLKVRSIDAVIQGAREKVLSLPLPEYEAALSGLLDQYAHKDKRGNILLDAKDASRLSDQMKEKLSSLSLTVKEEPIGAGFILQYGDIEENCTLDALIRNKKELLTDMISRKLFAKDGAK